MILLIKIKLKETLITYTGKRSGNQKALVILLGITDVYPIPVGRRREYQKALASFDIKQS
jgi:hypothetical protein